MMYINGNYGVQFNVPNLVHIFELFGTYCNPICGHVFLKKYQCPLV